MTVFSVVAPCSLVKVYDVSEVLAASIIKAMMEAVSTSEKSVNFYQTQHPRRRSSSYSLPSEPEIKPN
jgi:hypothetical protein